MVAHHRTPPQGWPAVCVGDPSARLQRTAPRDEKEKLSSHLSELQKSNQGRDTTRTRRKFLGEGASPTIFRHLVRSPSAANQARTSGWVHTTLEGRPEPAVLRVTQQNVCSDGLVAPMPLRFGNPR